MGLLRAFDVAGAIEELNLYFLTQFYLSLKISGWERLAPTSWLVQLCSFALGSQVYKQEISEVVG